MESGRRNAHTHTHTTHTHTHKNANQSHPSHPTHHYPPPNKQMEREVRGRGREERRFDTHTHQV